ADFENAEYNGWEGYGDVFDEALISVDPEDSENSVMECIYDCALSDNNSGMLRKAGLSIVVDGDTATALVINVWVDGEFLEELDGIQIYCMDQSAWQWQSAWYSPQMLIEGSWNRLVYQFSQSFENVDGFETLMNSGLQCGIEFIYLSGSDYYGSVYADNIYLLGVAGTTHVGAGQNYDSPSSFKLEQNYPNPFNPITYIAFTLPQSDQITVCVYDINGRLVTTLVDNESQPAGRMTVPFNASGLSSGIYYYRVQTSNATQMKKMVLVR
ncbi:T9SS type A sorting domain-containing protein, partial [candidate division KSB1 bacterium]|nr:T9SS type A sorting domain-containing protein [candidate division KSB1 bacterium]